MRVDQKEKIDKQFKLLEQKGNQLDFLLKVRRLILVYSKKVEDDLLEVNQKDKALEYLKELQSKSFDIFDELSLESNTLTSELKELFDEAIKNEK